uniref:Secreted protein n=1 Tax=Heterorhabditis bacteriophora TaxID=37862 RepID=A0A1I7WFY1_HETBA
MFALAFFLIYIFIVVQRNWRLAISSQFVCLGNSSLFFKPRLKEEIKLLLCLKIKRQYFALCVHHVDVTATVMLDILRLLFGIYFLLRPIQLRRYLDNRVGIQVIQFKFSNFKFFQIQEFLNF